MAKVVRRDEESLESLLKRWKRAVNDEMILADMKKREAYVSKSEIKREKKKEAIRKQQRQLRRAKEFKQKHPRKR